LFAIFCLYLMQLKCDNAFKALKELAECSKK
jgi:hypothetical protein